MLGLSSSFEKVKLWLFSSDLVLQDKNDENCGGVHSYYDVEKKEYGFLYPEITGYFLSTIRFIYNFDKNPKYLALAKSSANWLIQIYKKYGGIIMGLDSDKSKQKLAFSFDTAICAKGLLDYFVLTQEKTYLEYGTVLIKWLLNAISDDGFVAPYKNIEKNQFEESDEVWYKKKGCLHIKTVMPLLQLYQISQDNDLLDIASRVCNTFVRYQNEDGSFSIHEKNKTVNLHTQCYAMEGLLYAYSITKNDRYLKSCEKATDWSSEKIQKDGGINLWFNSRYESKASYSIAQLIRLMILIDSLRSQKIHTKDVSKLHSFLLTMQISNSDQRTNGGFVEEYYKTIFGWRKKQKINSWGSMFALQAIKWYELYNDLEFNSSIEYIY